MAGMEITPELAEKVLRGGPDAIAVVRGIYQTHVQKLDALESEARKIRDAAAMLPLVWIPAKERMPPDKTVVLAWGGKRVAFGYVRDGQWIDTLYGWVITNGPSHWMPLPPPPDCTQTVEK
jgi:hypothetical protein